ncbi:N-acetylmuramoyl-L-alanine amidase [Galactobacter sp.]|uniref:N-acetylmuramoyl-L-alanine amidase n=1 Tax=Galactobacter sp. TaxID=2676125 RepID=UPI0025BD2882|nr:N-acetylmuramoyl-L-alanine amidase [Galactobacter sp.]
MAWYSKALKKKITRNYTATKTTKTCIILHTAASNGDSLHAWFSNPSAAASSHFYVRKSGVVEQYVDTAQVSWASGAANSRSISIETEGLGDEAWTTAQVTALIALCQWIIKKHPGIPTRQMDSSSATDKGIGWHRLGCDGNFPETGILRGRNQRGKGESWSKAYGKVCPGDDRIKQVPAIVAAVGGRKVKVAKAKPATAPRMVSPVVGYLTMPWHGYANHAGMDIGVNGVVGREVRAAFAGVVTEAVSWAKHGNKQSTWAPGRTGNGVKVQNADGEAQGYNHITPCVKVGQRVKAGDVIGHTDTSGQQSGPHLHFECWADANNHLSNYDPQRCFDKYGVLVGSAPIISEVSTTITNPPTIQKDNDMKLAASRTRTKDQTVGAGKTKTIKLTDKNAISLGLTTKGTQFRADAVVHVQGLPGDEAVDLRWIVVDYAKNGSKIVRYYPAERVIGASGISTVTGHPSVTSATPWTVAAGHTLRIRLQATNRSKRNVTISQVRSTYEKN